MGLQANNLILGGVQDFQSGINALASQFISDKEEENRVWAQKAFSEFAIQSTSFQEDSKNNYQSPDYSGFSDSQGKWYDETTSKIVKDAPSESASLKLQDSLTKYKDRFVNRATLFEAEQKAKYYDVEAQRSIDNFSNHVYLHPDDYEFAVQEVNNSIDENKYIPPARKIQLKQEAANGTFISRFKGLQRNIMDRFNNKELTASQAIDLFKETSIDLQTGQFTNNVDSNVFVSISSGLSAENDQFKTGIINKEKTAIRSEFVDHIASIEESGKGVLDSNRIAEFAQISDDPTFVKELQEKENTAYQLYETKQAILKDPENASQYLASLKPDPGESEYQFKLQAYNTAQAYSSKLIDTIEKDPVSLLSTDESVIAAAQSDVNSATKTNTILALSASQIEKFKTPPSLVKFLSETDAKAMVRDLNNLEPDAIEARLDQLEQQYDVTLPSGRKAYSNVYAQLIKEGLDPGIKTIAANKGEIWVDDLISARKVGYEQLVKALPNDIKVSDIDTAIETKLDKYKQGVTLIGGTRSSDFNDITHSIKMLSLQYINRGFTSGNQAVDKAYENVIGKKYEIVTDENYSDAKILIPREIDNVRIDTNQVKKELFFRNSDYFIGKFIGDGKLYLGESTGLMSEQAKAQFSRSNIVKNGFWYTDPDGTGATYYIRMTGMNQPIPLKVRTKQGKIKTYKLDYKNIHNSQSTIAPEDEKDYEAKGGKTLRSSSGAKLNPNNYNSWFNEKVLSNKGLINNVQSGINASSDAINDTITNVSKTATDLGNMLKKGFESPNKPEPYKIINGGRYKYNPETGEYE
jgi:hypothetical protein